MGFFMPSNHGWIGKRGQIKFFRRENVREKTGFTLSGFGRRRNHGRQGEEKSIIQDFKQNHC
jgi:hypothetical protein